MMRKLSGHDGSRHNQAIQPFQVIDPATNTAYVLVRADVFERMVEAGAEDFLPRATYPFVDAILRKDNASDPLLAGYQSGPSRKRVR